MMCNCAAPFTFKHSTLKTAASRLKPLARMCVPPRVIQVAEVAGACH